MSHRLGSGCAFGVRGHMDFTVIHTNGIHNVDVWFCRCGVVDPAWAQLMDVSWWSATPLEPQTCATATVLRQFTTLNTLGKVSGYDYFRSLEMLTDNTGLKVFPVRWTGAGLGSDADKSL